MTEKQPQPPFGPEDDMAQETAPSESWLKVAGWFNAQQHALREEKDQAAFFVERLGEDDPDVKRLLARVAAKEEVLGSAEMLITLESAAEAGTLDEAIERELDGLQ
jgi:hypothetical protein